MSKALTIWFVFSLLAGVAGAQVKPEFETHEAAIEIDRKQPSIFHRPARATPAEQLAYADELRDSGHTRKALRNYRALVHAWHSAPQACVAQESFARLLEERRSYEKAFNEYQYLIDNFPGQFKYSEIVSRQFAIAHQVMTDAERRFTRSTKRALPMLDAVIRNAPNGARAAESAFYVGWIHESHKDYLEAVSGYEVVLYNYPKSDYAATAAFRRAVCLYTLARRNRRDEAAIRDALSALTQYLSKYKGDDNAATAQSYQEELKEVLADIYYDRAAFYDRIKKNPEAAVIAYRDYLRNFPSSERAVLVSARIEELLQGMEPRGEQQ